MKRMAEEALALLRDMHADARRSRVAVEELAIDVSEVRRLLEQEAAYHDKRLVRVAGQLVRRTGVCQ